MQGYAARSDRDMSRGQARERAPRNTADGRPQQFFNGLLIQINFKYKSTLNTNQL